MRVPCSPAAPIVRASQERDRHTGIDPGGQRTSASDRAHSAPAPPTPTGRRSLAAGDVSLTILYTDGRERVASAIVQFGLKAALPANYPRPTRGRNGRPGLASSPADPELHFLPRSGA